MAAWSTERLTARRFADADAMFVLGVHRSTALRTFIPSAGLDTLEQAEQRVLDFQASESLGRGWWCVTRQSDGLPVGALLLQPAPPSSDSQADDVEVGWRAHPAHVGHGYMTEAAAAVISAALADGLPRVIALVHPSNTSSIRVCQRLGMTNLGMTRAYYNEDFLLFEERRAR